MIEKYFLEHTGAIDYSTIDHFLSRLKSSKEFRDLNRPSSKRLYSIVVECLENIALYSEKRPVAGTQTLPYIFLQKLDDNILVRAGNPVRTEKTVRLKKKIDWVNKMNQETLLQSYDCIINREFNNYDDGTGLGFIIIRLYSGNHISYNLTTIENNLSFFEILVAVNIYVMRKLLIDPRTNSPKVVLDPEKNIFEISGESRPPDVSEFYGEILEWIDDYSSYLDRVYEVKDPVVFNFDFEYFNSSSAKYILDFCKKIADIHSRGKEIMVKWHYDRDDMDMLEVGREMSRMSKIPFEYSRKEI